MKKYLMAATGFLGLWASVASVSADIQQWQPNGLPCASAGTWDTTTPNWVSTCDAGDYTTWVNGNSATFTVGTYTVTLGGDVVVSNLTLVGTSGGPLVFSGTKLIFTNDPVVDTSNRILTMSGVHDGGSTVVLTKVGSGTLALGSSSSAFQGKYLVTAGRLSTSSDRNLGPVPGTVVDDYITLTNGGGLRTTSVGLKLNANRGINLAGNGTLEVSASFQEINSKITGPGNLTIAASAGTSVTLFNTGNNYQGSTTINSGGVLKLGASEVIPHSQNVNVTVNGTLDFNGFNETLRALAGSGSVLMGANNMSLNRSSGSASFSGIISGSGNITKSGAGTQTFSGANTFTGKLMLNGGRLAVPNDGALGAVPGSPVADQIRFNGGVLRTTAGFALNPNRGITLAGNGTWEQNDATTEASYDGVIAGTTGTFTKSGAGTLVLNGVNTYTGPTTVSAGTLKLGNAGALPATTSVSVNGGVLDINNFDLAATGLSGSGTVLSSGGLPGSLSVTNARVAAGTSTAGSLVGALTMESSLTMVNSTNFWELGELVDDTDGIAGTNFDQIVIKSGAQFTAIGSVLSIGFTNAAVAPDFATPFWQVPHKWTVVKMDGGSNPSSGGFTSVVTSGYYPAGTFSTAVEPDGSISVSFTPAGPTAPIILTQPPNTFVAQGSNTTIAVSATGTAPLSYQWYFNTSPIGGATDSALSITGAQLSDAGPYYVEIMNGSGSATSSNAILTVVTPPNITTQPAAQSTSIGGSATFFVEATGGGLAYQWKFNGANISGATLSSYTRSNAQTNHAGNYSVLVTNLAGSTLSSNATLTVSASTPPVMSASVSGGMINLVWSANAGSTYRVQYRDDLTNGSWVDVVPDVTAGGSTASTSVPIGPASRFYRVMLVP